MNGILTIITKNTSPPMDKQLVEVSLLNQALGLHPHTSITATLNEITELVLFRKNHESCTNIIDNLKHQLAHIQVNFQEQTQRYLEQKLEIYRQESKRLFAIDRSRDIINLPEIKKYPHYESLEQFMEAELELKVSKNKEKSRSLKIGQSVSQYFLPPEGEQRILSSKERSQSLEKGVSSG
jgi:hypothetical protein